MGITLGLVHKELKQQIFVTFDKITIIFPTSGLPDSNLPPGRHACSIHFVCFFKELVSINKTLLAGVLVCFVA